MSIAVAQLVSPQRGALSGRMTYAPAMLRVIQRLLMPHLARCSRSAAAPYEGCSMSIVSRNEPVVLILNKELSIRRWIEVTIRSAGLQAHSFDSGIELLSHLRAGTITCAVLDVDLPDGSGFELQRELSRAGILTVFVTRERHIDVCVRAIREGAVDFLPVPCEPTSLVRALRSAIAHARTSYAERMKMDELCAKYGTLTPREQEVFALVCSGMRNKQIAYQLQIREVTVQIHRGQVMRKMEAPTLACLVRMADRLQRHRTLFPATSWSVPTGRGMRAPMHKREGGHDDSGVYRVRVERGVACRAAQRPD